MSMVTVYERERERGGGGGGGERERERERERQAAFRGISNALTSWVRTDLTASLA